MTSMLTPIYKRRVELREPEIEQILFLSTYRKARNGLVLLIAIEIQESTFEILTSINEELTDHQVSS